MLVVILLLIIIAQIDLFDSSCYLRDWDAPFRFWTNMSAEAVRVVRYKLFGLFRNVLSFELTFHPNNKISTFDGNSLIFFSDIGLKKFGLLIRYTKEDNVLRLAWPDPQNSDVSPWNILPLFRWI